MKYQIIKVLGKYHDDEVGSVHLSGAIDTYACGLAEEDFESKATNKPITCSTCLMVLEWAKKAAKIKS